MGSKKKAIFRAPNRHVVVVRLSRKQRIENSKALSDDDGISWNVKGLPERNVGMVEEEEVAGVEEEHGGDRGGERRGGPDEETRVVGEREAGGGESEKAGSGNGFVWIGRPNDGVGLDMDDEEVVERRVGFGISD